MPYTMTVDRTLYLDTSSPNVSRKTTTSDNRAGAYPTIAAAKEGDITTRTSASVGTLTMDAGHGFITGDLIDVYWTANTTSGQTTVGKRTGVIVGTVATNSVPITAGSGDDLPLVNTPITAMKRSSEDLTVTGDNVVGIAIISPVPGYVSFAQSNGTTIIGSPIPLSVDDAGTSYVYIYQSGTGVTNPLAGGAVGKVILSHGDSTASRAIQVEVRHN